MRYYLSCFLSSFQRESEIISFFRSSFLFLKYASAQSFSFMASKWKSFSSFEVAFDSAITSVSSLYSLTILNSFTRSVYLLFIVSSILFPQSSSLILFCICVPRVISVRLLYSCIIRSRSFTFLSDHCSVSCCFSYFSLSTLVTSTHFSKYVLTPSHISARTFMSSSSLASVFSRAT